VRLSSLGQSYPWDKRQSYPWDKQSYPWDSASQKGRPSEMRKKRSVLGTVHRPAAGLVRRPDRSLGPKSQQNSPAQKKICRQEGVAQWANSLNANTQIAWRWNEALAEPAAHELPGASSAHRHGDGHARREGLRGTFASADAAGTAGDPGAPGARGARGAAGEGGKSQARGELGELGSGIGPRGAVEGGPTSSSTRGNSALAGMVPGISGPRPPAPVLQRRIFFGAFAESRSGEQSLGDRLVRAREVFANVAL